MRNEIWDTGYGIWDKNSHPTSHIAHRTSSSRRGLTLLEVIISLAIVAIAIVACVNFITIMQTSVIQNQDRAFAIQKALTIINELRAYAMSNESSGGAAVLDTFDDGINSSPLLTINSAVSNPADILSGNSTADKTTNRWRYARQISIKKFASLDATNVRIANVKVFLTQPGSTVQANTMMLMADVSSVVTTNNDNLSPTQVYDIYLLGLENIPGWWVYLAYLQPFMANTMADMEARNPGLIYRQHWITESAYGRDQEYKPYFNNTNDSNSAINYAYFYPGTMPNGSAVSQYYIPNNVNARINIDNVTVNDYSAISNAYPYTLADQYNHAMRYSDELALFTNRVNANLESLNTPTYRLLLDDMYLNPQRYKNAIFINLHGELVPMPALRNYSDAAKDPATYPGWRAVTHPEKIRYDLTNDVRLRVYAYLSDPAITTTSFMSAPISIVIPGMNLTQSGDLAITEITGGINVDPDNDGNIDTYAAIVPAITTVGTAAAHNLNRMYETQSYNSLYNYTLLTLYNTPLRAGLDTTNHGLDPTRRLYGMDYIPCPVEAANNFSQSLTSTSGSYLWQDMADLPSASGSGSGLAYPGTGDYIYGLRGGNANNFYRYSISGNSWSTRANASANMTTGSAICSDGNVAGNIYAVRGGQTTFYVFSISGNSWSTKTAAPAANGAGAALVSDGNYVYELRGGSNNTFYRYSIGGNSWSTMTAVSQSVGTGGSLCYTGTATTGYYVYALCGNSTKYFYRYSISANSWVRMTDTPGNITTGASLCSDNGDKIYAFQGGSTTFYVYSISANTWTTVTPAAPAAIGADGALTYASGAVYGLRGGATDFWRYGFVPVIQPVNTARWIINISSAALIRELAGTKTTIKVQTFIGNINVNPANWPGVRWPAAITPPNRSNTYTWWGYTAAQVPLSEQYQFQGDPRHCPYADVKGYHGYNWFFDNFVDGSNDASGEWGGFNRVISTTASVSGWHGAGSTTGDMLEMDVPRFFQLLRMALQNTNSVFSTITGWSFYYMGVGNEIGYDSANGFPNSIPVSSKPFDGSNGTRYEDSITSDQTNGVNGGVKYIRENVTPYWWGMPWLGELYPDRDSNNVDVYTNQWKVNGNLSSGTGAGKFVRYLRRSMSFTGNPQAKFSNRGTTFYTATNGNTNLACVRRTQVYGCTSFYNIGTATSTFRHSGYDGESGSLTAGGSEMSTNFYLPLAFIESISRPFQLAHNWGDVPTEFDAPEYDSPNKNTCSELTRFYNHQEGAAWTGSSLLQLKNPANTNSAFIVASGIDRTAGSGTSFVSKYALMSLLQGFLLVGSPSLTIRAAQVPQLKVQTPNAATQLSNPNTIAVTWSISWTRWDGLKYTSAYPSTFVENTAGASESDLRYALLYSTDNAKTWHHMVDNSVATPGIPNTALWIADQVSNGNETYNWNVSNAASFPAGTYIIMVEAYRNSYQLHYAFHQQSIYINR